MKENPEAYDILKKYRPTYVQLQVWEDLCHVAPTLSFTRPAKYMYRSIAQFGAWALARSQKREIDILDDDDVSVISTDSESEDPAGEKLVDNERTSRSVEKTIENVGKAGDPLPSFRNHMIRQSVDRHGRISPLQPAASLPALQVPPSEIGVIKRGPVEKWMTAKKQWDTKFANEKRKVQKQRIKEMKDGYQSFGPNEFPPPSALAGRRGASMPKVKKVKRSWGMSLWSLWGSSHDEKTVFCIQSSSFSHADKMFDSSNVKKKQIKSPILLLLPKTIQSILYPLLQEQRQIQDVRRCTRAHALGAVTLAIKVKRRRLRRFCLQLLSQSQRLTHHRCPPRLCSNKRQRRNRLWCYQEPM